MSGKIESTFRATETTYELVFESDAGRAVLAQPRDGYAMITVAPDRDGPVLERYYGFDMALDHAAELLAVRPHALPVPDDADVMGI